MTQVAGSAYGQRPKLTPKSMGGIARVAVRILDSGSFSKPGLKQGARPRSVFWISTVEPRDHIMFLTADDLRQMVERLGDETERWNGERVVLELVNRSFEGRSYEKYAVAPAPQWDDVLRPLDAPAPPGTSARRTSKAKARKPRTRRK